jgi:hypothetical protein
MDDVQPGIGPANVLSALDGLVAKSSEHGDRFRVLCESFIK